MEKLTVAVFIAVINQHNRVSERFRVINKIKSIIIGYIRNSSWYILFKC